MIKTGFRSTTDIALHDPIVKNLRRPPISSPNRRGSLQVVAGSMHSGKLSWTEQLSWV